MQTALALTPPMTSYDPAHALWINPYSSSIKRYWESVEFLLLASAAAWNWNRGSYAFRLLFAIRSLMLVSPPVSPFHAKVSEDENTSRRAVLRDSQFSRRACVLPSSLNTSTAIGRDRLPSKAIQGLTATVTRLRLCAKPVSTTHLSLWTMTGLSPATAVRRHH